jgi:hypothetical protein
VGWARMYQPCPVALMESIVVRDRLLLRWECRDMRAGMARAVGVCVQCRTRVRAKVAIEHLLEGGLCRPPRRRRGVRVASEGAAVGGLEV